MSKLKSTALGFAAGLALAAATAAFAQQRVAVGSNGVLVGYTVQKDGKTICKNPSVYNQFRGPESYIICD